MTAPVISLESHRRNRERGRDCSGCRDGQTCYPHRLEALADRLDEVRNQTSTSLLVSAELVDIALTDALAVIGGIVRECLPVSERSAR